MRDQDEIEGHGGAPRASVRARAAPHAPPQLPAPLTSFVGRSGDVTTLVARLGETRLLTLTGIGGIGKSRLALEVARAALGTVAHDVCLVQLAAISQDGDVAGAVASALGVHEAGGQPLVESLIASLAGRDLLLILDNCEHVVDAASGLASATSGSFTVAGSCGPRPNVQVQTSRSVPGQVVAVVRPGQGSLTGVLRIGPPGKPIQNATVGVAGGPSGIIASQDVPIGAGPVVLTVTRRQPGAVTVPLAVADTCGAWQTFVGFGTGV